MQPWEHEHIFGQDQRKAGELRTLVVVVLTAVTMVVEVVAGVAFGSMALLADGLHMASHATALAISLAAYVYARRNAHNEQFCFGTGKVNSLAGFTGAILLGFFALAMVWESCHRLLVPVPIAFTQAILVAFAGLVVNGVSVVILGGNDHSHAHENPSEDESGGHHHEHHHDHNLRSAYLHVLADALTSVLAIVALLAGKFLGANWLDPVMGIVGAVLVARWSIGLLRSTSAVLLDHRAPSRVEDAVREVLKAEGVEVADLHVWAIGPAVYCAAIAIVTDSPQPPEHYRSLLPSGAGLRHVTIEIHRRTTPDNQ